MRAALLLCAALSFVSPSIADELSGADKLRVVYSNQFAWTDDGLPVVTVRIAEGRDRVVLRGPGLRIYPDGEGGPEIRGGATYTVKLERGRPGKVRYHVVVARLPVGDDVALKAELTRWRERGEHPATLETGALFAVRGEVLDQRRLLVTVGDSLDEVAGRARVVALRRRFSIDAALQPELSERPAGIVEATDEHGTIVRNDAILWFASSGLIEVDDIDKEGGGRENRRYFGRVYVTADRAGKLAVVNAVPEDRLLAGLVPAEMMASAPPEALKAQAIAARNELLAKIGTRHLTDPYRLCSTQHCQVYAGAGHEDARATAAVSATRGVLLEREGGGLVDAVYSASCGGHTEDNDKVWGGVADSALRGTLDGDEAYDRARSAFATVTDANVAAFIDTATDNGPQPYCARNRVGESTRQWTVKLDLAALGGKLGIGTARTLTVQARGVSGRVSALHIEGTTGTRDIKGELEVRRALGNLRSALFVVDGDTVRGLGHGHGIGMCQLGAMGMAEHGKTVDQILRHYYTGTHLRRLY
ncbi:MAG: SpoIID/LytB domain-containing protein [Polyangia bacterium]